MAIVGPVGAGKSSLLSAFLGEMEKIKGTVSVRVSFILYSYEDFDNSLSGETFKPRLLALL